jgi:transaldolase
VSDVKEVSVSEVAAADADIEEPASARHRSRLHELHGQGQSVWIDYLSRELTESGGLAQLMADDAVVGVTSNPTIFERAILSGSAYDEQLIQMRETESSAKDLFYDLVARDIDAACELLLPVWTHSRGLDGYVSWEVDPNLADDHEASTEEALRLYARIDRPNLYVKIPATRAGLTTIEDLVAAGKNVNVTLIFSLQRYREVVEAYLQGLERLVGNRGDPATVRSVASFFVSRLDTEVDSRLEALGGHDELMGQLGIANAKLAYQHYLEAFAGHRWERLASAGATPQRCLWASTSTKNPSYRDVMYVEALIGPETVNTMPAATIEAFQDHGRVAKTLTAGVPEAEQLLRDLEGAGINYDEVVTSLERGGVDSFVRSFGFLLSGIIEKRDRLARPK